jgi:CheY-like chemotaxis protein
MNNESAARPFVLLVEDLEWIREGMRASLEACGYRVAEARDDLEALEAAERLRPSLIVTEEEFPAFQTLLRRLREHHTLSRVPVAVINPDAEEGTRYGQAHVLADYEQLERLLVPHAPVKED